jgi:hypothetical protein
VYGGEGQTLRWDRNQVAAQSFHDYFSGDASYFFRATFVLLLRGLFGTV